MTQHATAQSRRQTQRAPRQSVAEQLAATTRAVAAADAAALHSATDTIAWRRRGLLRMLTRRPKPHAVDAREAA